MPKWFIKSTLIIIALIVASGLIWIFLLPTIQMQIATGRIKQAVKRIQVLASNEQYHQACAGNRNATSEATAISAYQMRFINRSQYVIEAICQRLGGGTVGVGSIRKLPFNVYKSKGSGLIWPIDGADASVISASAITLTSQGYDYVFSLEKELTVLPVSKGDSLVPGANAPATSCEGWGLQCCPNAGFVGVGPHQAKVTDCRDRCYETCQGAPTILFFNANPIMDTTSREVTLLTPPYSIEVGYQLTNVPSDTRVSIDFGDGTVVDGEIHDTLSHQYTCTTNTCKYNISLSASIDSTLVGPHDISVVVIPQE